MEIEVAQQATDVCLLEERAQRDIKIGQERGGQRAVGLSGGLGSARVPCLVIR